MGNPLFAQKPKKHITSPFLINIAQVGSIKSIALSSNACMILWDLTKSINTGVFKSDLISKKIRAISAETIRYYGTSFSYWIAM